MQTADCRFQNRDSIPRLPTILHSAFCTLHSAISHFGTVALITAFACAPDSEQALRPNFLIIVADDLGYSDLGVLGSEIRTPNIDGLAAEGVLLTNFYVSPNCSPTRAMLLTGTDTHPAGLGTMAGDADEHQEGHPGYEGFLSDRVVTVASLLRDAGYHTSMAGKWHLGGTPERFPNRRGFERSFGIPHGGASHFSDVAPILNGSATEYREDGELVTIPDDFFSSDAHTDKLIEYIDESTQDGRPFFAYAAYTAPHWPLQAPDDYLNRYRGAYDDGYDALRMQRVQNLIDQGVVPDIPVPERLEWVPAWDALDDEQKRIESRRMEIYAAMVENLDDNIGRLIDYLKQNALYENTVIIFFSDNGAEGNNIGTMYDNETWIPTRFDNSYENMGRVNSFVWSGPGWAQAQTAPFRLFKSHTSEGGVRTPAIVRYREFDARRVDMFASVKDVTPTLLEMARVEHPSTYEGRDVAPMQGRSMASFLSGRAEAVHGDDAVMGWELFGRRAIVKGDWKLVWLWEPYGSERWELYDLVNDPAESHDLSSEMPERRDELLRAWEEYVSENDVILPARDMGYGFVDGSR